MVAGASAIFAAAHIFTILLKVVAKVAALAAPAAARSMSERKIEFGSIKFEFTCFFEKLNLFCFCKTDLKINVVSSCTSRSRRFTHEIAFVFTKFS